MRKVVLFGAGQKGQELIKSLKYDKSVELVGIIDNDVKK